MVGDITKVPDLPNTRRPLTYEERVAACERAIDELRLNDVQMRNKLLQRVGAITDTQNEIAETAADSAAAGEIQAAMMDVAAGAPLNAELMKKYPRAAAYLMKQLKVV